MQRGWEVRAGLGCMLGNKGGWADFRPGPAEGLRGSPMSLLPIWDGESMLRGHQRTAQGSLCGFAVATRPGLGPGDLGLGGDPGAGLELWPMSSQPPMAL